MVDSALVIGVTGIVVSGIVGPGFASWFARRSQLQDFNRQQSAVHRAALRTLLDQAATLLASGATNLRILNDPDSDPDGLKSAREWLVQVFPIGQRLQLWLPEDDPVVLAYSEVREKLQSVADLTSSTDLESRLNEFETERRHFLELSRTALAQPLSLMGAAS